MRRLIAVVCLLLLLGGCARRLPFGACRGGGPNDMEAAGQASEQTPPECVRGVTYDKGPITWGK